MADTIRIGMYLDRGWAIEGRLQTLNPNFLPVDVTSSAATTFTASYRGIDYIFPISDLALFLDRSYLYIPYPSYLIVESTIGYMKVGDSRQINVRMRFSNGSERLLDFDDLGAVSSNPDVIRVDNVQGAVNLVALSKGEAIIRFGYDDTYHTRQAIIVVDDQLFAQSNFVGLFPNGIN